MPTQTKRTISYQLWSPCSFAKLGFEKKECPSARKNIQKDPFTQLDKIKNPKRSALGRHFFSKSHASHLRISPHKKEIVDTIVGSMLGDGWAEERSGAIRFHFHYSSKNVEYLDYLHTLFARNGYCSQEKPKKRTRIGKSGKIYHSFKMRTFSLTSFAEIYKTFYQANRRKRVPEEISSWLNARVLAIWIMDDGGMGGEAFKLPTKSFTRPEIEILRRALLENFDLHWNVQRHKEKYILHLSKKQIPLLAQIVKPFMVASMCYKLGEKCV